MNTSFRKICKFYNYEEIVTPILENIKVFNRSLGETSDIVSKEMFNFQDQGGDHLVLRPEGTAAIARAYISNNFQQNLINKYFYTGSMFRRERPQSGRLRQFNQLGVEFFGNRNFLADLEVILIAEKFFQKIGLRNEVQLELNSLGNKESRENYIKELSKFLKKKTKDLSSESVNRLEKNPLRILDSKDPNDKKIVEECPKISSFYDKESLTFFEEITKGLKNLGIKFKLNLNLVRGLDYYNHTAFEYKTFEDKSQNTLLAGGRYDGLLSMLGGDLTTGVGWAAGVERILIKLSLKKEQTKNLISIFTNNPTFDFEVLKIMDNLNSEINLNLNFLNSGNFKKKLSKAIKINSFACIILAEDEWKQNKLIWKDLTQKTQEKFSVDNIDEFIQEKLRKR